MSILVSCSMWVKVMGQVVIYMDEFDDGLRVLFYC